MDEHQTGDCFTRDCVLRQGIDCCGACDRFPCDTIVTKPHTTVLDLLPLFEGYRKFRALDLGSGVGRNSIPVAQYFKEIPFVDMIYLQRKL